MNQAFEAWFAVSKYTQVIYPNAQTHQIALDGWQAASQHYEEKIAEMQAELDKARELLGYARDDVNECYQNILPNAGYTSFDRKIEDYKTQLAEIDAFLAKDK